MSVSTTAKKCESSTSSAIEILSSEISSIAREIEDMPEGVFGDVTNEQMVWMQHIDFCSQRLVEVSKLIKHLSDLEKGTDENLPELMKASANLEHVRNLFK